MAGPEVFLPDAAAVMNAKRRLAREHGFEPTGPGSDESAAAAAGASAEAIYRRNKAAMRRARFCIANLTPFRGISADPGTVQEIGFMVGLGRRVWGYTNDPRDYGARVRAEWGGDDARSETAGTDGSERDREGLAIETFGLCDNLMIEMSIEASGGQVLRAAPGVRDRARDLAAFAECLQRLAAD